MRRVKRKPNFLRCQDFWRPIVQHWLQVVLPRLVYFVVVLIAAWFFDVPADLIEFAQALAAKF